MQGIWNWKGLLYEESRKTKVRVFIALLILSTSLTFTQFGFIGLGAMGYMLGLLAPVAVTSLLLGKGAGTLFGLISGTVLFVHAKAQPLDLVEYFFVTAPSSLCLYAICGFLSALLFAIALRNKPVGWRRTGYLVLTCLAISVVAIALFYLSSLFVFLRAGTVIQNQSNEYLALSADWEAATDALVGIVAAAPLDFLLVSAVCLFTDSVVRHRNQNAGVLSVRTTFSTHLFVVVVLAFAIVQALSFVAITIQTERTEWRRMGDELEYLAGQLDRSRTLQDKILDVVDGQKLTEEKLNDLASSSAPEAIFDGYDLTDGTVIVFQGGTVTYSYNPAFETGSEVETLFDTWTADTLKELVNANRPVKIVYRTQKLDSDFSIVDGELAFARVQDIGDYYLMMAMPFSLVFANRQVNMIWATVLAIILATTAYIFAQRLMGRNVMAPIDRTNASLSKITAGNLDETVDERENVEFASLSDGINETVGALKRLITDAERRNERDLATAKAIQESALPRTFPPFPDVDAFDIFAAMNAAKVVGGDFFDFFLVDDDTLGFLIADVSGKGIPGALFMMAAKSELENHISSGMELSDAIARTNRALCANNDAGMFVTVWAATLNWRSGELAYVNAGHNFPLLRHGKGGTWEWLKKKCGLFLGTFETAKYRQEKLTLQPGDELLLYTDGVNEAFDPAGNEYGNDRLEEFLKAHTNLHPRELVRSLRGSVSRWADGAEQSDDVTILALEYGTTPEITGELVVPATLDHLDEITDFVLDVLKQHECPKIVQHQIAIALEELFVNVCNYAYLESSSQGDFRLNYGYSANPSSITVELHDTGVPFDPVRKADPKRPTSIEETRIGGLGILMTKRTMNDFTYQRDGNTNVVIFSKSW